jgi:glycosyltransferase involved in cell wall biosynthesis
MRIGVIAAEMEGARTGVGRYLEGLVSGLASWDHGAEWHLYFQGEPPGRLAVDDRRVLLHGSGDRGSRVVWEQFKVVRELTRHRLDIVVGPAYTLPFGLDTPSAVVLHDLSFELLPGEFGPKERWRRRLLARRAVRVADRVITDTEHLAGLVCEHYRVPAERLGVVPLGVDQVRFSRDPKDDDGAALARLGVSRPYVLWAGTILERRCPQAVLEAFAKLRATWPELQLVVAGANRMRAPDRFRAWVSAADVGDAVRELGWVAENDLAPLYRNAELGIYVSRHEGFGIPPLEFLACGTPVVVSRGLGLDEAWPDYPFCCSDCSAAAIESTARSVLQEPERAVGRLRRAAGVLAGLDWERTSRLLMAELERVVRP